MAVMIVERPLREKLGDEGTNSLVKLFDRFEENIKVDVIALSADKYERRLSEEIANIRIDMGLHKAELKGEMVGLKAELKGDMAELRAELKESEERYERRLSEETGKIRVEMAGLRVELKGDMAELKSELKQDMAELRTEMAKNYASIIKWMFIFWLGQIGAILGILFAFFKS